MLPARKARPMKIEERAVAVFKEFQKAGTPPKEVVIEGRKLRIIQ